MSEAGRIVGRRPAVLRWSPDVARSTEQGNRPQRKLTAREREVAGRAAGGMGNEQIAHELCVSRRTVEFHLSNAYRKLGIFRRGQLRDAMEASQPCASCERAVVRAVDRVIRSGSVVDGILSYISSAVATELAAELANERRAGTG